MSPPFTFDKTSSSLDPATENEKIKKNPTTSIHLIAGAAAGLVSAFTLQPLDLLKTRLQQQQRDNLRYRPTVMNEILKLERFSDLWRGVLPSTLRTSVGAGLYFTILSRSRQYLALLKASNHGTTSSTSVLPKLSPMENLVSGFVARALIGVITMPITVIKTRYESSTYSYNSMYESLREIYHGRKKSNSGSLRNFFKGTVATLARDCPYAGLYVLFYEGFKDELFPSLLRPFILDDSVFAGVSNSASAIAAAFVASAITAPFDSIKTRLQLNTATEGSGSIGAVTRQLMKEQGGTRNLFNGLSLRLGRKALSAGISWCIYEELLKFL